MRRARLALALLLLLPASRAAAEEDPVLAALRGYLDAHYALRFQLEEAAGAGREAIPSLEERQRETKRALLAALETKGLAEEAGGASLLKLAPTLAHYFASHADAVVIPAEDGSIAIARVCRREQGATKELWGETVAYNRVEIDGYLVRDYSSYARLRRGAPAAAVSPPAVARGRVLFLDRAALRAIGREAFFARLEEQRALAERVEKGSLQALAREGRGNDLARELKAYLRWRSLSPLVAETATLAPLEREERFADRYGRDEELRAVAHLRFEKEAEDAARAAEPAARGMRVALARKGLYTLLRHGDPRGALATLLGLALRAQEGRAARDDPSVEAAEAVLAELPGLVARSPDAFPPAEVAGPLGRLAALANADDAQVRKLAEMGLPTR